MEEVEEIGTMFAGMEELEGSMTKDISTGHDSNVIKWYF